MQKSEDVRIDKWLWAIRVYKTRSIATDECKKGRVSINGDSAKPSKVVKVGDIIEVRKPPIIYRYKVKGLLDKRVGAQLVSDYMENITPEQEIVKLDMMRMDLSGRRDRGSGRPTKKDRRTIDLWKNSYDDEDEF